MGPVLPFLNVFGKQLGVSEVVMGTITAVLPILFLLAKPAFGLLVDRFRRRRKLLFMCLVAATGCFYVLLGLVPPPASPRLAAVTCRELPPCDQPGVADCDGSRALAALCDWECADNSSGAGLAAVLVRNGTAGGGGWQACAPRDGSSSAPPPPPGCDLTCRPAEGRDCLYGSPAFWGFVLLMALGTIGFNVSNSVSDAICFDMLGSGEEMKYGRQRVFGTVGFGVTALLAGYAIDWWSAGSATKDYTPAFVLVFVFTAVDLCCCSKLQLPPMPQSQSILKDVGKLLKHKHIIVFIAFATLAGINDSFIIYYLFWFLEDLAMETNSMANVKLLEGLVIAAETLVGEVIFFTLSGKILKRIGYGYSLTLCFLFYAVRLGLVAVIPGPWWLLPVELFLQGPTYAMCYTTIVAYASAVAPPGASATVQGLVAGMDDGFGYAVGSMMGGLLYRWLGGRAAFAIAAALSLLCSVAHGVLYECMLKHTMVKAGVTSEQGYKSPEAATAMTVTAARSMAENEKSET
ncbi:major facilitator superfamily domain-containing protein 6 isoform X2 [Bacillus rossius redtenbacheri]